MRIRRGRGGAGALLVLSFCAKAAQAGLGLVGPVVENPPGYRFPDPYRGVVLDVPEGLNRDEDDLIKRLQAGDPKPYQAYLDWVRGLRARRTSGHRYYPAAVERNAEKLFKLGVEKAIPALKRWQRAVPEDAHASALLAKVCVSEAWRRRGNTLAAQVTERGWAGMRKYMGLAKAAVETARKRRPDEPQYLVMAIEIMLGSGDTGRLGEFFQELEARSPGDVHGMKAVASLLHPKWYGAPGDELAFARWAVATYPDEAAHCELVLHAHRHMVNYLWLHNMKEGAEIARKYRAQPEVKAEVTATAERLLRAYPEGDEAEAGLMYYRALTYEPKHAVTRAGLFREFAARGHAAIYHSYQGALIQQRTPEAWREFADHLKSIEIPPAMGWLRNRLGLVYLYGLGVPRDPEAGFRHLMQEAAREGGYRYAKYRAGSCLFYGVGTPKNEVEGLRWMREGAAKSEDESAFGLASALLRRGSAKEVAEAVEVLRKAIEVGDPRSMVLLGRLYQTGKGLGKDPDAALDLYRRAMERMGSSLTNTADFYSIACGKVGDWLEENSARILGPQQAEPWYRRAMNRGNSFAADRLYKLYSQGEPEQRGGLYDLEAAAAVLSKGLILSGGHPHWASRYDELRSRRPPPRFPPLEKQLKWARGLVKRGNESVAWGVASLFERGVGGFPKDPARAARWSEPFRRKRTASASSPAAPRARAKASANPAEGTDRPPRAAPTGVPASGGRVSAKAPSDAASGVAILHELGEGSRVAEGTMVFNPLVLDSIPNDWTRPFDLGTDALRAWDLGRGRIGVQAPGCPLGFDMAATFPAKWGLENLIADIGTHCDLHAEEREQKRRRLEAAHQRHLDPVRADRLLGRAREEWGRSTSRPEKRDALERGEKACRMGSDDACNWTASQWVIFASESEAGLTIPALQRSQRIAAIGAARGHGHSAFWIGLSLVSGFPKSWKDPSLMPPPDPDLARHWLSYAAGLGMPAAHLTLRAHRLEPVPGPDFDLRLPDYSGNVSVFSRAWTWIKGRAADVWNMGRYFLGSDAKAKRKHRFGPPARLR